MASLARFDEEQRLVLRHHRPVGDQDPRHHPAHIGADGGNALSTLAQLANAFMADKLDHDALIGRDASPAATDAAHRS